MNELPHYPKPARQEDHPVKVPFTLRLILAEIQQELNNLNIPLETVGTLS